MQLRTNKVLLFLSMLTLSCLSLSAQKDTTAIKGNGKAKDSLNQTQEKEKDSIPASFLSEVVNDKATDYKRIDRQNKKMYLYNEAQIDYKNISIKAGEIILDYGNKEVIAKGIVDTTEKYVQKPVFTKGGDEVRPDSLRYNFDTKKALIHNSNTAKNGIQTQGKIAKRENDSVIYMKDVKFTTAESVEDADYYFRARKIKFVPDKKIVSGLVNMYIADVPTPLGLPFGFFPMTKERSSGFIIPTFGDNRNRGFSLTNGGYYFAISDYLDLTTLLDLYSNGSYGLRFDSNYNVRYKFSGNLSLRFEKLFISEPGLPDFQERTIYNLRWSHNQAQKASPNSRFSASVNLGSSEFFRQSANQVNQANSLNNSFNSSVSYSKRFNTKPEMNLNLSATHNQNSNTEEINMTLPTLQFSIGRFYPFEPKSGIKEGAIENINMQYNLRGENRVQTTDSLFFQPEMFNDFNNGMQHTIPLTTNFKVFKHFSVSTSANYNETWAFRTFDKSFDEQRQEVVTDTVNGFEAYRTYNASASVGTTVYGMFKFGTDSKIKAIRHVMQPSISYSINPGFDQYYDTYNRPVAGRDEPEEVEFSRFQGTLFGAPNNNFSSSLNLSINNDFEAKVRKKDSTLVGDERYKKRSILSNLSFDTRYNLAADSLKLSPIGFNGTLPVVQDELSVNFRGELDLYALDNNDRRIDKLNINNGGSLFRFTRGNVSFSYKLSDKIFNGEEDEEDEEDDQKRRSESYRSGGRKDDLFGSAEPLNQRGRDKDDANDNDLQDYNFGIPWNLNLSYTFTYNNSRRQKEISSHSIMFNADVELSPRWSIGGSSGFDLRNQGFTFTQLRFARDLKSWRMTFNWTPFGRRESWFFFIGIKSNIFSDIKYDKNREPLRRLN